MALNREGSRSCITARGVLFGAACTLLGAVLGAVLTAWLGAPGPRVLVGPHGGEDTLSEVHSAERIARASRIIREFWCYGETQLTDLSVTWLNLSPGHEPLEFYARYVMAAEPDARPVIDVFTVRDGEPENLYHRLGLDCTEYLAVGPARLGTKTFLWVSSTAGSGGYLDLLLYDYDGVGKLRLVHKEEALFGGYFCTAGEAIYLCGAGQRYVLTYDGQRICRDPYTVSLVPTEGTHVLKITEADESLEFSLDGKKLVFVDSGSDRCQTAEPVRLIHYEQVFVDVNLANPRGLRFLGDGDGLEFTAGFILGCKPRRTGGSHLSVSDSYDRWYDIKFVTE